MLQPFEIPTPLWKERSYARSLAHKQRWRVKKFQLEQYLEGIPSLMQSPSSTGTLGLLRYLFRANGCYMKTRMTMMTSAAVAKDYRQAKYMRQKVMRDFVHEVYGDLPVDKTVLAIGDARWVGGRKGHEQMPANAKWILKALNTVFEDKHRAAVMMVNEFNTSKAPPCCLFGARMVPAGGKEDRFLEELYADPEVLPQPGQDGAPNYHLPQFMKVRPHKTWPIRRCPNPACRTVWNRDTGAGRNIAYVANLEIMGLPRPILYRKSLPDVATIIKRLGKENSPIRYPPEPPVETRPPWMIRATGEGWSPDLNYTGSRTMKGLNEALAWRRLEEEQENG